SVQAQSGSGNVGGWLQGSTSTRVNRRFKLSTSGGSGDAEEWRRVMQDREYDAALSFAGEDRARANALAEALRTRGVRIFYDAYEKADIWGKNLYDHLSDVYLNKAQYCVMLLSFHYTEKVWTNHERKAAQVRAVQENQEYILPVHLGRAEVDDVLPAMVYLEWPPENA